METIKNFIFNLYANDSFPIYIGIVLAVLVAAFIIVYIIGKKDQKKIEETQKLQAINTTDAFAKESTAIAPEVKVEQVKTEFNPAIPPKEVNIEPVVEQPVKVVPEAIEPVIPEVSKVNIEMPNQEPVVASVQSEITVPKSEKTIQQPVVEPNPMFAVPTEVKVNAPQTEIPTVGFAKTDQVKLSPELEVPKVELKPELEPAQKNDPFEELHNITKDIDKELTDIENKQKEVKPIVENNTKVVNNIYSSVYVPPKEDSKPSLQDFVDDDLTMEIELPKLKTVDNENSSNEPLLKDEESKLNI